MKFRILVGVSLVAIAYGVLYTNLPCCAQVFAPSFTCGSAAEFNAARERGAKANDDEFERAFQQSRDGYERAIGARQKH